MVWVDHNLVLAGRQLGDADLKVIESHVVMPRVAPGRFKPQPESPKRADGDNHESFEPDEGFRGKPAVAALIRSPTPRHRSRCRGDETLPVSGA